MKLAGKKFPAVIRTVAERAVLPVLGATAIRSVAFPLGPDSVSTSHHPGALLSADQRAGEVKVYAF